MTSRLARFAAVGLAVTATDLAVLVVLRVRVGLPVVIADALSIAVAGLLSYGLHRSLTFGDDPSSRWVRSAGLFAAVGVASGVVDVAVLRLVVLASGSAADTVGTVAAAKAPALAVAATLRLAAYRRLLFSSLREDQRRPATRAAAPGDLRLSVIIPAYAEEARIGSTIAGLRGALAPLGRDVEIVVVDDGSPDATAAAATAAGADQVIVVAHNRGKGAAVRAGAAVCRGRTIAFTDADLAYAPAQLLLLLDRVEAGWDVVVGSRRHVDTKTLVRARRLREVSGRLFNLLTTLVLLGQYRDTQCGLKAFRADVAHALFRRARIDGFAFDVELFHLAERLRLSLAEVPVELANTVSSTVHLRRDALRMIRDLIRIRWWAAIGRYGPPGPDGALGGGGRTWGPSRSDY